MRTKKHQNCMKKLLWDYSENCVHPGQYFLNTTVIVIINSLAIFDLIIAKVILNSTKVEHSRFFFSSLRHKFFFYKYFFHSVRFLSLNTFTIEKHLWLNATQIFPKITFQHFSFFLDERKINFSWYFFLFFSWY